MQRVYFTPGPSALYFTAESHIKHAIRHGITSISHRSSDFEYIYEDALNNTRSLLNLPDDYHLVFTGSASEIWEKMTDAFIDKSSLHFVNGAFSEKFYQVAKNLGKGVELRKADWGKIPDYNIDKTISYDHLGVTHNETSTGVKTPLQNIYDLRQTFKESIISVDVVSSLPVVNIDYSKVDSVYASVQKAFGMPAGLGIWLFNDRALKQAENLSAAGLLKDSSHNILSYAKHAIKFQTPSTPNILGIYLYSQITKDMLHRGIKQIRNDSVYKAAIMYNMLGQHAILRPFVIEPTIRSETIIVVDAGDRTYDLIAYLSKHKMEVGDGYGKMKGKQVRIANFPTHSREQFEMLVDLIEKFE